MLDVINQELIFLDTNFTTQGELFEFIADKSIEYKIGNDKEGIVKGFYDREQEFSTAMNQFVAIPHCRNKFIDSASVIVIRNKNEITWTDGEIVKYFFSLLVPESNENQMHIRILAAVAQLLLEDEFIELVEKAENPCQIYEAMKDLNNV